MCVKDSSVSEGHPVTHHSPETDSSRQTRAVTFLRRHRTWVQPYIRYPGDAVRL